MVAIKFLGLILTFYIFFILEVFGQNFYPARYGKRDESDSYQNKNLESRRIGRGDNQDVLNRKMGFFVSGGRFGKRGCSGNCFEEGSKELISEGYQNRQDRSDRIRIPIRKNQFMIGTRFGKRREGFIGFPVIGENRNAQLKCNFIRMSDLFKCLEKKDSSDEDGATEFNSSSDFVQ